MYDDILRKYQGDHDAAVAAMKRLGLHDMIPAGDTLQAHAASRSRMRAARHSERQQAVRRLPPLNFCAVPLEENVSGSPLCFPQRQPACHARVAPHFAMRLSVPRTSALRVRIAVLLLRGASVREVLL